MNIQSSSTLLMKETKCYTNVSPMARDTACNIQTGIEKLTGRDELTSTELHRILWRPVKQPYFSKSVIEATKNNNLVLV